MMRTIFFYTIILITLGISGCSKFLEKAPDNRTELNTPTKVSQLLGTAYPQGNYMDFAESLSDNVADKTVGELDQTNFDSFYFEDVADINQDSPEAYWNACYTAIAAANQALEVCNNAENKQDYISQKGEALVARAYSHFMLVTLFSKVYDPTTAATDPGIPYVTTPENIVIKKYERKTVAYVYEMIEKDLLEGLPLLNDQRYTVPKYHFTVAAANAFAARFFLFKGNYQKVIEHANQVFGSGNPVNKLRPWNTTYRSMTYQELFATYARATEAANLLLIETPSWWARSYYTVRYAMNTSKRDVIYSSNVTGGEWSFRFQTYSAGANNILIPKINEYFVQNSINANIGVGYVMVPALTTEEVLFNRAEANALMNNSAAALEDLNIYASTRIEDYNLTTHRITETKIKSYYGISDPQIGLLRTILDFKRAEYAQEGMRWFDILRYRIPVVHPTSDGQVLTLGSEDPRRVLQIPQSTNLSGLEPNPR
jgi:hypothetical protein